MNEIASRGQLRMSLLRYALFTVPAVLLLGTIAGTVSNGGANDLWYDQLAKGPASPPDWVFGVVWPILYIMQGMALALVLQARGATGRGAAVSLFGAQFILNLSWSPIFFGAHEATLALIIILGMLVLATATTVAFGRIRSLAAWLMLPYLAWLGFAAGLNYDVVRLNPQVANSAAPASF